MIDLQACYSISDIIFASSLFVIILTTICTFISLMIILIKGAILEVYDIKTRKDNTINTQ